MDENTCREWLNEVNWDIVHTDAVTMYLEWGNNNFKDAIRQPVRSGDEYSIYFVVDTWEKLPKVVLMKMDNYGSTVLCERKLPEDMALRFKEETGGVRGILELSDEVKDWLIEDLDS